MPEVWSVQMPPRLCDFCFLANAIILRSPSLRLMVELVGKVLPAKLPEKNEGPLENPCELAPGKLLVFFCEHFTFKVERFLESPEDTLSRY